MATPYLRQFGSAAIDNGWNPTPIRPGEKAPLLRDWQDIIATIPLWQQWISAHYGDYGLGILTGHCVCIDIDTLDMAEAQFWTDYIRIVHGGLIRYGRRPKLAIILRCETIITKITSMAFVDPQGHKMQMEVLAKGQQFVAFGRHPDTGTDYEWVDDLSPATVRFADVIVITEAELRQLVAMWNERYIGFGWKRWSPAAGPGPNGSEYVRPDPPPNGHASNANGFDTSTTGSAGTAPPPPGADADADELHDAATAGEGRIGLSNEEIEAIVMAIPNGKPDPANPTAAGTTVLPSRDQWLKACFAIEIETGKSQFGRQLFFRWSAQYDSNRAEWEKVWNSIHDLVSRPVTFRWLLLLAKPYIAKKVEDFLRALAAAADRAAIAAICADIRLHPFEDVERSLLIGALKLAFRRLGLPVPDARTLRGMITPEPKPPHGIGEWRFLTLDGQFYNPTTGGMAGKESFDLTYRARLDNASETALERQWIKPAYGRMYLPHVAEPEWTDAAGLLWVNSYSTRGIPAMPARLRAIDRASVELFEWHVHNILAPDDRSARLVLSFLADRVQTNRRANWMPILTGTEKIGKTFLAHLMMTVLGTQNVNIVEPALLYESSFTDWMEGFQLIFFEDILQPGKRYSIVEKLKPMIGSDWVSIHPKGRKAYKAFNTMTPIAFTNHEHALALTDEASRFFVVNSPYQSPSQINAFKAERPAYFAALYSICRESPGALRNYLLQYRLHPAYDRDDRAPWSAGTRRMVEENRSPEYDLLQQLLLKPQVYLNHGVAVLSRVCAGIISSRTGKPLAVHMGRVLLKEAGFRRLARVSIDNIDETVFTSDDSMGFENTDQAVWNIRKRIAEFVTKTEPESDTFDL